MVKTFYLMRHGETMGNRNEMHQGLGVPLSPLGKQQVAKLAERVKELHIDLLLASDALRAQETATAISDATGQSMHSSALFREIARSPGVIGKHILSPLSLWMYVQMYIHAHNPSWHFMRGGENISELRARANQALSFLETETGDSERIAVVSHRTFIGTLILTMQDGGLSSVTSFLLGLATFRNLPNASITTVTFDPTRAPKWQVEQLPQL